MAVRDLAESVETLTTRMETLARSTEALARKRTRDRVTTFALIALALALTFVGYKSAHEAGRTSCRAVNATNAALLRLIERANAAAPTAPPDDASPSEVRQFTEQRARGQEFLARTRTDLAPRAC